MSYTIQGSNCFTEASLRVKNPKYAASWIFALFFLMPYSALAEIPKDLHSPIQEVLDELIYKVSHTLGVEVSGSIAVYSLETSEQSVRFFSDFNRFVTEELGRTQPVIIDTPQKLSSRLESLYMDISDFQDVSKRQAFYRSSQGNQLKWVLLLSHSVREKEIHVTMTLEQVESGGTSMKVERDIIKADSVYQYLGEPVPRILYVKAPAGARVYVEQDFLGFGGNDPVSIRLQPGSHHLNVDLAGYAKYNGSVDINDRTDWEIEVKKHDNSGAPFKSFLLGALIPGLSVSVYGSPKTAEGDYSRSSADFTSAAAGVFYIGLGVWAVDHFRDKDPLTTATKERDDRIETIELGICLTGYALNLIGSFWMGTHFAEDNRSLEATSGSARSRDLSLSELSRSFSFGVVQGPDGPVPALTFARSF